MAEVKTTNNYELYFNKLKELPNFASLGIFYNNERGVIVYKGYEVDFANFGNSLLELSAEDLFLFIKGEYYKSIDKHIADEREKQIILVFSDVFRERSSWYQRNINLLCKDNVMNVGVYNFLKDIENKIPEMKNIMAQSQQKQNNTSNGQNIFDTQAIPLGNSNSVDIVPQESEVQQFTLERSKPGSGKYNFDDSEERITSAAGFASIILLVLTSILLATYIIASLIG